MDIAILRDNNPDSSLKWEIACQNRGFSYLVIDLLRNDWLENLRRYDPSFCVSRPPGNNIQNKKVFDEKLFFIEKYTSYKVFPGYNETVIYENKASLAYFLQINNIPHPHTFVSSSIQEAEKFIVETDYPIVAKTLIGAAGSGVKILKSKAEAKKYIRTAFNEGINRRYGPNRKTGSPFTWIAKSLNSPVFLFKKLKEYKARNLDIQKGVVLFQQYVPHEYEWRCVKIGESYFAYKKLRVGDMASGSKKFDYDEPPFELLDFTKDLCARFGFNFMAIDLFYNHKGILVNELQTIFGHKNPYICKVNDKPGRYLYSNRQWIFEEGDFNTNESYDLRLESAIEIFKKNHE